MTSKEILLANSGSIMGVMSVVLGFLLGTTILLTSKLLGVSPGVPEVGPSLKEGLEVVRLHDLQGNPISSDIFQGERHLLILASTDCSACEVLYPLLVNLGEEPSALLVFTGNSQTAREKAEHFRFSFPVAVDSTLITLTAFQLKVVPSAILVDRDGLVEDFASGKSSVAELIRKFIRGTP